MSKTEKRHTLKLTTSILGVIAAAIGIYLILTQVSIINIPSNHIILEQEKEILQLDIQNPAYIGMNNKQIVKVTKDGITAYDLDGEELWSDTLTLDNYIVRQRESFIAVANKMGTAIILFNDKGRQGQIVCKNPIAYFSVNKSGGVAVIESLGDSHILSAYDYRGNALGVKRITYVQDKNSGYPAVAELSPDNKVLLASYIDVDKPVLTSTLIAIQTQKPKDEALDHVLYGIEQKDNLIYEIEFVKDNEWVVIGDKMSTWYTLEGKEIARKSDLSPAFNPYLIKSSNYGDGFFPIISAAHLKKAALHRENELVYLNAKGEKYHSAILNDAVTYFYADDKGVIIGQMNKFTGYDKTGSKLFEFTTSQDINKVFYLQGKRRGIAVAKDKVLRLSPKREGES